MTSAVFDTNIYFQAILSDQGPARACLQLALDDKVELIATGDIFVELEDVISRPNLVTRYPQLLSERAWLLVRSIKKKAKIIDTPYRVFPFERDPADEVFIINVAIEASSDYLVSRDRDLLDLGKDEAFTSSFPKLKVVDPVGFLEVFRFI